MTMNKITIEPGMKRFALTSLSKARLLCTIVSIEANMITVKLPCKIRGYTHTQVKVKDILLKQNSNKPKVEKKSVPPKENPYRKHLNNLLKNPRTSESSIETSTSCYQDKNEGTIQAPGDLIELTLLSMPIEERRGYISSLGSEGKKYVHLLKK